MPRLDPGSGRGVERILVHLGRIAGVLAEAVVDPLDLVLEVERMRDDDDFEPAVRTHLVGGPVDDVDALGRLAVSVRLSAGDGPP